MSKKKERRRCGVQITYCGHPMGDFAELRDIGYLTERQWERKAESLKKLIGTTKTIAGHEAKVRKLRFNFGVFE